MSYRGGEVFYERLNTAKARRQEQRAVPGWSPGRGGTVWASIIRGAEMLQDHVSLRKGVLQVGPSCSGWLLGGTRLSGGACFISVLDRALGPETLMSFPQRPGLQELGL